MFSVGIQGVEIVRHELSLLPTDSRFGLEIVYWLEINLSRWDIAKTSDLVVNDAGTTTHYRFWYHLYPCEIEIVVFIKDFASRKLRGLNSTENIFVSIRLSSEYLWGAPAVNLCLTTDEKYLDYGLHAESVSNETLRAEDRLKKPKMTLASFTIIWHCISSLGLHLERAERVWAQTPICLHSYCWWQIGCPLRAARYGKVGHNEYRGHYCWTQTN